MVACRSDGAPSRSDSVPSRIAQRFSILSGLVHETQAMTDTSRQALISMAYGGLFEADASNTQLRSVEDHDLELLHRASDLASFYSTRDNLVRELAAVVAELHPGQEMAVTFKREECQMVDSWDTPTFHFLENGVVRAKVQGWPKKGHRSELLAGLQKIGLAP